MSGDQEFEDFLRRRRPLFRNDVDDGLEPPAELDRIILREARAAIEGERPMRLFGMPRWAAPVAIAATLVIGLSVVLKTGMEPTQRVPEVRVENVAQRLDYPPTPEAGSATAPSEPSPAQESGSVVVDLASPRGAQSESQAAPPRGEVSSSMRAGGAVATANSPSGATEAAPWRRDARAWQAEIERLRASGDRALAEAEQAEFNRQYRAYAVSPDR